MLAQADFQRALGLALGEFAPAWTIVGECSAVDRLDASHWGSGPQSFQVTLRHRVTGHLKVLGRRASYEPGATVHPAVALSLVGAYRHGNPEPIRRYLEEIGVVAAASAGDATHFVQGPATTASPRASASEPADRRPAVLAVAASVSASLATAAVGGGDGVDSEVDEPPQRSSKPWSLTIRKTREPMLPIDTSPPPREVVASSAPGPMRSAAATTTVETGKSKVGRFRRELELWYWRRGAHGKEKPHARD